MLLNLPLNRPAPWHPTAIAARLTGLWRHQRARRAVAARLTSMDAATGLTQRRPATLWLHAAAGIAARKGETLAVARVTAAGARPRAIAAALAAALPPAGLAARWDEGVYVVAVAGHLRAQVEAHLTQALATEGVCAEVQWAEGVDPERMVG